MHRLTSLALTLSLLAFMALPAAADPFFFSTGDPNGLMAAASRPPSASVFEIESADDFILTNPTSITGASFTGLLPLGAPLGNISQVVVEIYRVFPNDSDVGRTSGPPTFSTTQVPTRVNSPSDEAFDSRNNSAGGGLSFTAAIVNSSFTANNSVAPGGIHPKPNQTTLGNGPVSGEEVTFNVAFTTPFNLPADHYFFIPQVQLISGDFFWLSASRPIVPPGTPFPAGSTDLQSWTRDAFLDPDWLRIGTDIVDGNPVTTFNAAFTLSGETQVPIPASLLLLGSGLIGLLGLGRSRYFRKG